MSFTELCVFDAQKIPPDNRTELGCLVLAMRKRMQYIKSDIVHIWMPDAGPSEELLTTVQVKKQSLLESSGKTKAPFRKSRLGPQARAEWERFWSEDFTPGYRLELHSRQTCRAVSYTNGERTDTTAPVSPTEYLLSLEKQHGVVTLMCCEPNHPEEEECHRRILLADMLVLTLVERAFAQGNAIRLKMRTRQEIPHDARQTLRDAGILIEETPYLRQWASCLYAVSVPHKVAAHEVFRLPLLGSLEPLPTYSLAAL